MSFCAVPLPTLVYAGPKTREEFDLIAIEPTVHVWQPCEWWEAREAPDEDDGRKWERRCTSKTLGEIGDSTGVTVIFQWFDYRVVGAADGAA